MNLCHFNQLEGKNLKTRENEDFGKIIDLYFQDDRWVVRYLVVDTGGWFQKKPVLVSPIHMGHFNWDDKEIPVNLTKDQVKKAPSWNQEKPVTRQYETEYYSYYGHSPYWVGGGVWGGSYFPDEVEKATKDKPFYDMPEGMPGDPNLRAASEVKSYKIFSRVDEKGDFGQVKDFIFDTDTWNIRYLVIDTSSFLPGRTVLISPEWIDRIDWSDRKLVVELPKEKIKSAPDYETDSPPDRDYESKLYEHYGKRFYWENIPQRRPSSAA